ISTANPEGRGPRWIPHLTMGLRLPRAIVPDYIRALDELSAPELRQLTAAEAGLRVPSTDQFFRFYSSVFCWPIRLLDTVAATPGAGSSSRLLRLALEHQPRVAYDVVRILVPLHLHDGHLLQVLSQQLGAVRDQWGQHAGMLNIGHVPHHVPTG